MLPGIHRRKLTLFKTSLPTWKKILIISVPTIPLWGCWNTIWSPGCLPNISVWCPPCNDPFLGSPKTHSIYLSVQQMPVLEELQPVRSLLKWKCFSAGRIWDQIMNWHSWFSPVWISDASKWLITVNQVNLIHPRIILPSTNESSQQHRPRVHYPGWEGVPMSCAQRRTLFTVKWHM